MRYVLICASAFLLACCSKPTPPKPIFPQIAGSIIRGNTVCDLVLIDPTHFVEQCRAPSSAESALPLNSTPLNDFIDSVKPEDRDNPIRLNPELIPTPAPFYQSPLTRSTDNNLIEVNPPLDDRDRFDQLKQRLLQQQ